MPTTPPPDPAARLRGVVSSPVREILALTQRPGVISFAGGLPAPELLDHEGMRRAFAAVLDPERAPETLQYSTTEGDPRLRERLAWLHAARGLPTSADHVLVCAGSQQALTLVTTALLDPGDVVLVEEPSYLAALQAFGLAGARVVPVACDDGGLDPDALAAAAREHGATALYTIPNFQNPTGRTLDHERRAAIALAAAEHGFWIIEDDPYGELRYGDAPAPRPIGSYPGAEDRTIALSSLSKVLAPGLRIGWVRMPEQLKAALVVAKQASDLHTATVTQAAAAQWLTHADWDENLERLRTAYGARRDALLAGIAGALPEGSTWNEPSGGMFVWARLPEGQDSDRALERALQQDVAFVPGWPFYAGEADRRTLRLSFTTHTPEEIADGLVRLGTALR
ncbi:MAG: PLP-dependent aminotransferase family protein [Baekduia sp.]